MCQHFIRKFSLGNVELFYLTLLISLLHKFKIQNLFGIAAEGWQSPLELIVLHLQLKILNLYTARVRFRCLVVLNDNYGKDTVLVSVLNLYIMLCARCAWRGRHWNKEGRRVNDAIITYILSEYQRMYNCFIWQYWSPLVIYNCV